MIIQVGEHVFFAFLLALHTGTGGFWHASNWKAVGAALRASFRFCDTSWKTLTSKNRIGNLQRLLLYAVADWWCPNLKRKHHAPRMILHGVCASKSNTPMQKRPLNYLVESIWNLRLKEQCYFHIIFARTSGSGISYLFWSWIGFCHTSPTRTDVENMFLKC